jgi:hypothetical protein
LRGQPVRIVAALLRGGALLGVADHRPGGIIELQVATASVVERADRLLIGQADVVEVGVEVGIELLADRLPPLTEMQRRRRRDRHLRRDAGAVLEETEVVEMVMAGEADLADDADAFGLGRDPSEGDAVLGGIELDAVEPFVEVELPPRATKLAVGDELEPDLLLLPDGFLDLAILDLLQLRSR